MMLLAEYAACIVQIGFLGLVLTEAIKGGPLIG